MSELAPCPFCNSTNVGTFDKVIYCVDCYAEGPSGRDEDRCVRLWNTRAPDPAVAVLQAEVDGLRGVLQLWMDWIADGTLDDDRRGRASVATIRLMTTLPAPPKEVG